MKPTEKLASAQTPDGESLELYRHETEYSIRVNRQELMTSRANESERELARLGCARIKGHPKPVVLIGGLGMGFTLRETLDLLNPRATVVVGELMPEIVDWNRRYFGELADHPLRDPRVTLKMGDVMRVIRASPHTFDAILLDVDNGPEAFTVTGNDALYSREGVEACLDALRPKGCLAIWSVAADPAFERRLRPMRLAFRRVAVPAYKGAHALSRGIWIIARDPQTVFPEHA